MKSPLCYEVRSYEFPLRTGAISWFSSTTLPMPVLFMWGERAGEFLLRTVTALFFSCLFLLHYYFYVRRGRGIPKTFSPPPRIVPYREFTITVECKKSRIVCVEGIRQTLSPPPRIAPCRECTITVECKKSRIVCVEGIRQTLPSATHCSLPRVYNYCRMQEESHSLRRRNSSDPPLRHALLPAESLQVS